MAKQYGMFTPLSFVQLVQMAYGPDTEGLNHAVRVAQYARTESEERVALCHDLIEDSYATFEEVRRWGLTDTEIKALILLTKAKNEQYVQYVQAIVAVYEHGDEEGQIALHVKFYDIVDHLHPSGMCKKHAHKIPKYAKALQAIEEALAKKEEGWG